MAWGFPSCFSSCTPSCEFSRVTVEEEGEGCSAPLSGSSTPVVTRQPKKKRTETKLHLQFGGGDDIASQVQNVMNAVDAVVSNPRTQRGCVACYNQFQEPCSTRCGSFGGWFCNCFQACCIIDGPSSSNIPEIASEMTTLFGPISLGLALCRLGWDINAMTQSGKNLTPEEKEQLKTECEKAKTDCSGGFHNLGQACFFKSHQELFLSPTTQETLPLIMKILRQQTWLDPCKHPTPATCWLIYPTDHTPSSLNTTINSGQAKTRKTSLSLALTDLGIVHVVKYNEKRAQKYLSKIVMKSLNSGDVGALGTEKAKLILTVFESLLAETSGPHSPLVRTGGFPCYKTTDFIKLLMNIALCLGFVPVDQEENSPVDHTNPEDPFMQVFLRAKRERTMEKFHSTHIAVRGRSSTLQRQASIDQTDGTTTYTTRTLFGAVCARHSDNEGASTPLDILVKDEGDMEIDYLIASSQNSAGYTDESSDEEDEEILRQHHLVESSSQLSSLFAAMKPSS